MMFSFLFAAKPRSWFVGVLFLALLSIASDLSAQNPNGALRGEIQDPSGARVVGARVTVQSAGSSIIREAIANDHGEFRIEGLLPGRYHMVASAKGFAEATADVEVAVSLVRDVSITLTPQSGRETVNVQGKSSSITTEAIDKATAVHQGVRSEEHTSE